MSYRKGFISLDLETTHIDPREGRIMEVGASKAVIFFDANKQRVEVEFNEVFDTLVNPEAEVPYAALQITGIAEADLKIAPLWKEIKPKLKEFLGKDALLGHNLVFDLAFLAAQGAKLKNPVVDTLEISQTLLPTASSHALEFLGKDLGVLQDVSHRALSDCQNTVRLLAAVLNEFLSLPLAIQKDIRVLLERSKIAFRDLILDLPEIHNPLPNPPHPPAGEAGKGEGSRKGGTGGEIPGGWPEKNTILSLPLGFARVEDWFLALSRAAKPGIIAMPRRFLSKTLPKKQILADPQMALCDKRFANLLDAPDKSDDLLKLLIKITIFQKMAGGFDLSEVRFTRVERGLLHRVLADPGVCSKHKCGYMKTLKLNPDQVYFASQEGMYSLALKWGRDFATFPLLVFDLAAAEDTFAEFETRSLNLRNLREFLGAVYSLEGRSLPKPVTDLANELDLFFGILHLIYMKREGEFSDTLVVDSMEAQSEQFQKLTHPAEKLITKFRKLVSFLRQGMLLASPDERIELENLQERINEVVKFFEEYFFSRDNEKNYWLKFDATAVDLNVAPVSPRGAWKVFSERFKNLALADCALPETSLLYFQKRLGITDWKFRKSESTSKTQIELKYFTKDLSGQKRVEFMRSLSGFTIVAAPNERELGELFVTLNQGNPAGRQVLAYKYSGGLAALREKVKTFSATGREKNLTLVLTTNSILRFWADLPPADNLVVTKLPFGGAGGKFAFQGPRERNNFLDEVLPKAIHALHTIVHRFLAAGAGPRRIFLLDPRAATSYDQFFLKYFQKLSDVDISTEEMG